MEKVKEEYWKVMFLVSVVVGIVAIFMQAAARDDQVRALQDEAIKRDCAEFKNINGYPCFRWKERIIKEEKP